MSRIKAIVFDMDGVLIEAKEWHYESLNRALNLFGYNISREDHLDRYDGLPTRKKLGMLTEKENLSSSYHEVINSLKQMYTLDLIEARCKPNPVHEETLKRLKDDGFPLGLASNSVRNSVIAMMTKSRLMKYLDAYLSNQDVESPKPDPEIYIRAAKRLGLVPEDCLVVEDNKNGIASARAAGACLMVVKGVDDVNYDNIMQHIDLYNRKSA